MSGALRHKPYPRAVMGCFRSLVLAESRFGEFPFIQFELSIPVDGVIAYTPLPDYDEAARYGIQMFELTLIMLILEEPVDVPQDAAPPIEEPEPVPLPKAA